MFTKSLLTLLAVGLVGSCAKDKAFDETASLTINSELAFDDQVQSKAIFDGSKGLGMCTLDDPCLYLPSVAETPFEVTASRPFWQGAERLVVSNLSKKGKLQFMHIEGDARFQGNINNLSPVLNLSLIHI